MRNSLSKQADGRLVTIRQTLWVDSIELTFDLDPCVGCELCRRVCPKEAISLKKEGTRTVPWIEAERCSLCGLCATFCPAKAVKMVAKNSLHQTEREITPILDVGGSPHFSKGMKMDVSLCPPGCSECVAVCPREALTPGEHGVELDRSRCLSCSHCQDACPVPGAIEVTPLFEGTIEVDTVLPDQVLQPDRGAWRGGRRAALHLLRGVPGRMLLRGDRPDAPARDNRHGRVLGGVEQGDRQAAHREQALPLAERGEPGEAD